MWLTAWLMTSLTVSGSIDDRDWSVTYSVVEELPVGRVVGNVVDDFALRGRYNASTVAALSFEMLTQPPRGRYLALAADSWDLVVARRIDRESICEDVDRRRCVLRYTLAVRPLAMFRLLGVEVEVLDANDHAPQFDRGGSPRRHVPENADVGAQLAVATVRDRDRGPNGLDRYWTTTDCSGLDPRPTPRQLPGGAVELRLRVTAKLDRETQDRCRLPAIHHFAKGS